MLVPTVQQFLGQEVLCHFSAEMYPPFSAHSKTFSNKIVKATTALQYCWKDVLSQILDSR